MGGGGGVISTIASVVTAPVLAPIKIAETIAPDEVAKVEQATANVPVVGTLAQGAVAGANIGGDVASGVLTGNFSAARGDVLPLAKAGAVVGGAAAGGIPGAFVGDTVSKRGIDIGALTGAAASYFGNTLYDNTGIDLNKFLPKPGEKPVGSFDLGTGSVSKYFDGSKNLGSVEGDDNTVTYILAGAAIFVFLLALKKRR